MQKQGSKLRNDISAATAVLHHEEERPHLSTENILAQSDKADKTWRESGDRIILFMDHNKHVTNGPLGRELGDNNGLDLREAIIQHTGASPGATFFCGSKPIDACGSQETPISAMPVSCRLGTEYAIIVPLFSISRWTR